MDISFPKHLTLENLNAFFIKDQLPESFGLAFTEIGKDFIKGSLTVDERHLRPGKIMNGGVSLVLIETLGSMSAACLVDTNKFNPLGIQVTANHLAIARPGDVITATSKPVHIGRSTQIWDVSIRNQKDQLVCDGRITLLIAEKK